MDKTAVLNETTDISMYTLSSLLASNTLTEILETVSTDEIYEVKCQMSLLRVYEDVLTATKPQDVLNTGLI